MNRIQYRKAVDVLMRTLCLLCTALLGGLLLIILVYVIREGAAAISWSFLTHLPTPVGIPGGGMGNGIMGSILMVAMASLGGLPVGILCGVYLSEYGKGKFASAVRFTIEVLNGVPTIVFGILAYSLVVVPMHTFSAYAGAAALAAIMIPLVARATEVAVRQVPQTWREASIGLGAGAARTVMLVVLPAARVGITTAATLSVARIAGETAPLLFTALGNDTAWPTHPARPTAGLPLQVFIYATSPYPEQKAQAWAGALVLVAGMLLLNMVVRAFGRSAANEAAKM